MEQTIKSDRGVNSRDRSLTNNFISNYSNTKTRQSQIDEEQALTHLKALGYEEGELVYLRFFQPKGKGAGRKLNGKFPRLPWKLMEKLQSQGMGCYFVVNDGGHCNADIIRCRALFYEHDDIDKEQQRELWKLLGLPEPTFQVDTGGKSIHSYWVLSEFVDPQQWEVLQTDLLEFSDGDRSLKNPSRVMRLAGCFHMETGQQSTIISNSGKRHTYAAMRAIIPSRNATSNGDQTAQLEPKSQQGRNDLNEFLQNEVYPKLSAEQIYNWQGHDFKPQPESKLKGNCPFHESQTHTAFWVEPTADGKTYTWACPTCTNNKKRNPINYRHRLRDGNGSPHGQDFIDIVAELAKQAGVTMPALPKRKKDKTQKYSQGDGSSPPDLPRASILVSEFAKKYRSHWLFNAENQSWYCYGSEASGVWTAHTDEAIQRLIQSELDSHPMNGKGYSLTTVKSVMGLLKGQLLANQWEEQAGLLPFQNGVLEISTGRLLNHSPGYRFTWSFPRAHDPTAKDWSGISAWMDEATGNNIKIKKILLSWLNACLKGRYDLQRFLHLTGPGGSGKGTFMRLVTEIIGSENTHSSTLQDWTTNRFESANVYKKRLLIFWDEDKFNGNLGKFKSLIGNDWIRAEIKNKQAFQFIYEGMVMMSSNFPIFTGDSSSGMARRALVVPFSRSVSPDKRRNLDEEFQPELAALTNYVLSIPDSEVTSTLLLAGDESLEVAEQTWEYRMRTDSIAVWLNACVIREPKASEQVGDDKDDESTLFGSYWQYCDRTGSRPKGIREFSPSLLDLCNNILKWGIEKRHRNRGKVIEGLRLRMNTDSHIPFALEVLYTASDGSSKSDESVTDSSDGSEPLLDRDCDECDGSSSLLIYRNEPEQQESRIPFDQNAHQCNQSSIEKRSDLSVTSVTPLSSDDYTRHRSSVMTSEEPVTTPKSSFSRDDLQEGDRVEVFHDTCWEPATIISLPNNHPDPTKRITAWKVKIDRGSEVRIWKINHIRSISNRQSN